MCPGDFADLSGTPGDSGAEDAVVWAFRDKPTGVLKSDWLGEEGVSFRSAASRYRVAFVED